MGSPAATVKVGTLLTLRAGDGLAVNRCRKLKYICPELPTHPPVRLGERSSRDCAPAPAGTASDRASSRAPRRNGVTRPPGLERCASLHGDDAGHPHPLVR